jgi:hypothetical protein
VHDADADNQAAVLMLTVLSIWQPLCNETWLKPCFIGALLVFGASVDKAVVLLLLNCLIGGVDSFAVLLLGKAGNQQGMHMLLCFMLVRSPSCIQG